ncbi:MAG: hypothetical protein JNL36_11410 [Candidatus Kapabacteria bacterium]|nr:hypothetical protein [Candidatus Kapabacteria bacterium]
MEIIVDQSLETLRISYTEKVHTLREILLNLEQLENVLLPELRHKYDAHFREFEVKIQELTLQLSEKQRVNELLLLKYQRGEEITEKVVEFVLMFVQKEYAKFKTTEKKSTFGLQESASTVVSTNNSLTEEMSRLYKELVKKLHPDSSQKDEKLFELFWSNVQESYEKQNIQRLRTYHSIVCKQLLSPNMFTSPTSEKERLEAEISFLNRKITNEQKRISAYYSKEPYTFKDSIENSEWIANHTKSLQETMNRITLDIEQATKVFATITKGVHITPTKEKGDFDQNFTESTYFGGR